MDILVFHQSDSAGRRHFSVE